jgi:hypothetical protein
MGGMVRLLLPSLYGWFFLAGTLQLGAEAEYDDAKMCEAALAQGAGFSDYLTGGAEWHQCLEVSVVLVNDGVLSGDVPEDDHGKVGQRCVAGEHFTGIDVLLESDCPKGWNCNSVQAEVKACRNGLYCHDGARATCEQCSSCPMNGPCGNCRTTFYPRVDEYSVLRLSDFCDRGAYKTEDTCNAAMGCHWARGATAADSKCLPGPITAQGTGGHLQLRAPDASSAADADRHMVFTPGQEFYVEMGRDGIGNGVVRSPIVVFAQDNVEALAMYLKLGMVSGFPRKIAWEQTGLISSSCGDASLPHVKLPGSRRNLRPHLLAKCASVKDSTTGQGYCADGTDGTGGVADWPMTDCGFSTLEGLYTKEGKFDGMRWVGPPPDNTTIEGGPADDCSQDMCGAPPVKGEAVAPVQLYLTWMGTDKGGRDMTSGGLTYEAFKQYSAYEAFTAAKDGAKSLAEKSRQCVTLKQC